MEMDAKGTLASMASKGLSSILAPSILMPSVSAMLSLHGEKQNGQKRHRFIRIQSLLNMPTMVLPARPTKVIPDTVPIMVGIRALELLHLTCNLNFLTLVLVHM